MINCQSYTSLICSYFSHFITGPAKDLPQQQFMEMDEGASCFTLKGWPSPSTNHHIRHRVFNRTILSSHKPKILNTVPETHTAPGTQDLPFWLLALGSYSRLTKIPRVLFLSTAFYLYLSAHYVHHSTCHTHTHFLAALEFLPFGRGGGWLPQRVEGGVEGKPGCAQVHHCDHLLSNRNEFKALPLRASAKTWRLNDHFGGEVGSEKRGSRIWRL